MRGKKVRELITLMRGQLDDRIIGLRSDLERLTLRVDRFYSLMEGLKKDIVQVEECKVCGCFVRKTEGNKYMRETPTAYYEEWYCRLHNPRLQNTKIAEIDKKKYKIDSILCMAQDVNIIKDMLREVKVDNLVEIKLRRKK